MNKNEAIKRIKNVIDLMQSPRTILPYCHEELEALEFAIKALEADQWNVIRTEADLPEESDWYLVTRVFNSKKYVATVFFNENTKSFYEDSCTPLNNITHWRPLPEVPESEDQ